MSVFFAGPFKPVESQHLNRVVVEGVIRVGEQYLTSVIIRHDDFAGGVAGVGGDVKGVVGAVDGMGEHGAEKLLQHPGVQIVNMGVLVSHIGRRKVDDLRYPCG